MAGRNAKPVALLESEGKAKLSKEEIERRRALEIKLGERGLVLYPEVKVDPIAYRRWLELAVAYEDFDYVTSADAGIVNRLCLKTSELWELRRRASALKEISLSKKQRDIAYDLFVDEGNREYVRAIMDTVDFLLTTKGYIDIQKAINSKESSILADEKELFLTSLSRVKSIPKKSSEPANDLDEFDLGDL